MGCGIVEAERPRAGCGAGKIARRPRGHDRGQPLGHGQRRFVAQRTRGLSGSGATVRAWMAWHWLNRKGWRPPAVCSGASHCRPSASGEVS